MLVGILILAYRNFTVEGLYLYIYIYIYIYNSVDFPIHKCELQPFHKLRVYGFHSFWMPTWRGAAELTPPISLQNQTCILVLIFIKSRSRKTKHPVQVQSL